MREIQFTPNAWEEYVYWQETDRRILKRINELIRDVSRNPHQGIGKPEPLKHAYAGFWSRRITDEHRLVYKVDGSTIKVVQLRYHYA